MTVQCAYFEDPESQAFNGYVVGEPEINATDGPLTPSIPGTFEGLKERIRDGYNAKHPDAPVTVDDLEWTVVDPYRHPADESEPEVFVVDMAHVRSLPPEERMAAMVEPRTDTE